MCSNIPASPAYGVYISQLIRYARASSNYSDFLKRHLVCRRPAETVSLQRRQICYRWGTPAYWSLVHRSSMFYLYEFCLKNMWNWIINLFDERIVYSPDKDSVCSKRGTTEIYSRSGINHMWILKNSKDLLDNLKSRSFPQVSSIKTFDFSTQTNMLSMRNSSILITCSSE
jgi:hypothetical protein